MEALGILHKAPLRGVWPDEARDFTPWLADNIDALSESVGIELEVKGTEVPIGRYSVDILAEDVGQKRKVVIENQLEATNHDHLGKVLTYAAGVDAEVVIWLASSFTDEHRAAFEWLNRRSQQGVEFFGVRVELLKIDESKPAVNFDLVIVPAEKVARASRQPSSERGEAYREYFQILLDRLRDDHGFTRARKGQPQSWYSFTSGTSGIQYGATFASGNVARVEVYIDTGDGAQNEAAFTFLNDRRVEIESELGHPLEWQELANRRACRICFERPGSIDDAEHDLSQLRDWMVDRLLAFKTVFGPKLPMAIAAARDQAHGPVDSEAP